MDLNLLTARQLEVLKNMDSKPNFPVHLLDDEEAWHLFQKMTGRIEGNELKSVAREVANKCVRLPIVIVTVAKALRNKELFEWEDALQQMRSHSSENMLDIHTSMELSYKYLSPVLKKTIMLIRYANLTSIDELLMFGMGIDKLKGIDKLESIDKLKGRRARVRTLVKQLQDSGLLLDSNTTGEDFSMHDAVRDAVISIAYREGHVFTNEQFDELEWPDEKTLKVCSSIVLKDVKMGDLPQVLECQQMKLLYISGVHSFLHSYSSLKIHHEFFTETTELKVLVLAYMNLSSLPSSLSCLTNLLALGLYNCKLDDITIIGDLKKLEILSLKSHVIKQLPVEVSHLTRLKSLDLRGCFRLSVIAPHVISNLSQLEELYMGDFVEWEEEGLNKDSKNVSLNELKHLSKLTCLQIQIKDAKTIPRDLCFKNLERYKIKIGEFFSQEKIWDFVSPKSYRKFTLSLINTNICLKDGHIMQLKKIEVLRLDGSHDMESVLYGLDRDDFPGLKYLQVSNNHKVLCIVDSMDYVTRNVFPVLESLLLINLINLEKICRQLTTECSFGQLTKIKVESCDKLENIFSFSIARSLHRLQAMHVIRCKNMEEIFGIEGEDESDSNISEVIDHIELSQLRSLRFTSLPRLRSFCSKLKAPSRPQQRRDEIILEDCINVFNTLFTGEVALPNLDELILDEINAERIWQNQFAAMPSSIQNLTRLIVRGCNNLRCLFSSSMIENFVQLEELVIFGCPVLEEIMVIDDDDGLREEQRKNNVAFPISNMNNNLKMKVEECDKLKTLFPGSIYRKFLRLESLSVSNCCSLEVIFDLAGPNLEDKHSGVVTQLSELDIVDLPKLKHVWNKDPKKFLSFEKLNKVSIGWCGNLKNVFPASLANSLSHLESLDIRKCGVEEIVFDAEEGSGTNPRFVFPRLTFLTLKDLPKFSRFFPGIYTTESRGLRDLKIFPNLETLSVAGKSITMIWHFPKDLFSKLKDLKVRFDESTVISSLDFLQRFHNMKMLKVVGDYVDFIDRKVENVRSAKISNINVCSDLKHILKEVSNMDHLVHLEVGKCDHLVNLVPSSTSLGNLTTLEVYKCKGLTNIVTFSTAKSLVKLRKMTILRCSMITELVSADEGDEAQDYEIDFRELKELQLQWLESLKSFCSANCTLKFPSLEELTVEWCPEMRSFSGAKLITPKLQKVKHGSNWQVEECWKGDLNSNIQQLHEEMCERTRTDID